MMPVTAINQFSAARSSRTAIDVLTATAVSDLQTATTMVPAWTQASAWASPYVWTVAAFAAPQRDTATRFASF